MFYPHQTHHDPDRCCPALAHEMVLGHIEWKIQNRDTIFVRWKFYDDSKICAEIHANIYLYLNKWQRKYFLSSLDRLRYHFSSHTLFDTMRYVFTEIVRAVTVKSLDDLQSNTFASFTVAVYYYASFAKI